MHETNTEPQETVVTMYDHLKKLQSFAEGLGAIQGVNMNLLDSSGSVGISFEGHIAGGKKFRIDLIITEREDTYV